MPQPTSTAYLFTDIDGSTERWEQRPRQMERAVARHDQLIDVLIRRHGGTVRDRAGDGVFAIFQGGDPLTCALEIQLAIQREDWSDIGGLLLRVGVHVGSAANSGTIDQVSINRAARITAVAWAGQILVSAEAARALAIPNGARLDDLGYCQLRGIESPLRLYALGHDKLSRIDFPPLRSLAALTRPLAGLDSPFFGREQEIAQVKRLLARAGAALVTLVGPGGNGKTRLAMRLAVDCSEQYPVWFVPLEGVTTSAAAAAAIAQALRLPFFGAAPQEDQLLQYLRDKQGLLVLDNAEDLGEASPLVTRLVEECSTLRLLATSRAPLGVRGEILFHVGGFEAPGVGEAQLLASPAYQLFVHQAHAGQPGFHLDESEVDAFRDLCSNLHGSPLALMLAGQWHQVLPLEGIVARVRNSLDFLCAREASGPERHRSLRVVFEGSWSLLSHDQRNALARLSLFRGGFDAEAAEAVARLDLSTLSALQQRGLIEQRDQHRLVMHPLIHELASEKLAALEPEASETRRLHARYFLEQARTGFNEMASRGQRTVLDHVERETANLLAAWRYARQSDRDAAETATEALFYSLVLRGRYSDAINFFGCESDPHHLSLLANCQVQQGELEAAATAANHALQTAAPASAAHAHALHALGLVSHAKGEFAKACELYDAGLAIRRGRDDLIGCFYSLASLAVLNLTLGRLAAARACIKESLELCQRLGNESGTMMVYFLAGEVAAKEGRSDDARKNYRRSLAIEEALHHPQHRARILISLGALLASNGEYGEALECHQQALELAVEVGDQHRAASALLELGADLRMSGGLDQAKARLVEAIRTASKLRARPLLMRCLLELARVETARGDAGRAGRLSYILADAELGPLQGAYDAFAREQPVPADVKSGGTPETVARELVEEADLAALLL